MCGIIGRISSQTNASKTLMGLKELEYRGYDSFGILLYNNETNEFIFEKDIGEFNIQKYPEIEIFPSHIEIGHTRWATHGGVSQNNAHPHFDMKRQFFVVMNGIVENYLEIKNNLIKKGYQFSSETDTEVIPMLFAEYFIEDKNDLLRSLLDATKKVIKELSGEFSFLLKYKNFVIGYKNINPLIVGENDKEIFVSSDYNLVQKNSTHHYILKDGEIFAGYLENDSFRLSFHNRFGKINKSKTISRPTIYDTKKTTKYFMEKEIFDQKNLRNILTEKNLESLKYLYEISKKKKIFFTGAGTSYHAAISAHYTFLKMGILTDYILASELKNYKDVIKDSLIVVFSQSGETADLIFPLKELKSKNEIFTITNTPNSTLERLAGKSVHINCGQEIAVASTKAFSYQVFAVEILQMLKSGLDIENILQVYEKDFEKTIQKNHHLIKEICDLLSHCRTFFFLGRNEYYPFALEGALKLKEISYIHAEGFAGGELKHGSLALIEDGVPVIVLDNSDEIISNATEIKTRGGLIIGIADKHNPIYDISLEVPENLKKIFTTIIMQLLSFEMCLVLGHNPDKPRNLAKSVTVK